jgi:hypothetical protein
MMIIAAVTISSDETNGTWTADFMPPSNPKLNNHGHFAITIKDNGDANTIRLQCSIDGGNSWQDVQTYTDSETREGCLDATIGVLYRAGCANGDWAAGTPYVALTK